MCPRHGGSDDTEEGREFGRIGDVGILDVETTGLGIREEALDAPAMPIEVQYTPGVIHEMLRATFHGLCCGRRVFIRGEEKSEHREDPSR